MDLIWKGLLIVGTLIAAQCLLEAMKALLRPGKRAPTVREHLERCGYTWYPAPYMVYLDKDGWEITSEQMREALKTFE